MILRGSSLAVVELCTNTTSEKVRTEGTERKDTISITINSFAGDVEALIDVTKLMLVMMNISIQELSSIPSAHVSVPSTRNCSI